jgi:hypothetical protein
MYQLNILKYSNFEFKVWDNYSHYDTHFAEIRWLSNILLSEIISETNVTIILIQNSPSAYSTLDRINIDIL